MVSLMLFLNQQKIQLKNEIANVKGVVYKIL